MYHKHALDSWLHRGMRYAEQGLKIYEAGTAIGGALQGAYQLAGPALALL